MPLPRDRGKGCGQLLKYTSLYKLASWTPQPDAYSLTKLALLMKDSYLPSKCHSRLKHVPTERELAFPPVFLPVFLE